MTWFHTLRYLRPVQIYGRAWLKLYRPTIDLSPEPAVCPCPSGWIQPAQRQPSFYPPRLFRFLNEEHELVGPKDWDDPSVSKLWRYNLHYFDDLNAEGAEIRTFGHHDLLVRWVKENPPAKGTGWEPYPTSIRIVNWIKWLLAGNTLPSECLHSLAVQIRWLCRRLEFHLLGNHLFVNAKALVFAGLFFSGQEANKWLKKGLRILAREVPEQILADGGQFERSTMYHALALEDMLDLYNVTKIFRWEIPHQWQLLIDGWPEVVGRMQRWLAVMCHPDEEIGLFNDAAIGIAAPAAGLAHYAARLGLPPFAATAEKVIELDKSGYVRIQQGPLVALLDVAPLGPSYLAAHGHADTLSFELSLFGQRLLVNSGTSCYGVGEERLRQRGTAAHNTVVVDGQNSSEVWGGFRVARRAHPSLSAITERDSQITIDASHDGYQRLRGKNIHRRKWVCSNTSLTIEDEVTGSFRDAEARFLLHPEVRLGSQHLSVGRVVLHLPKGQKVDFSVEGGSLRLDSTTWHPCFGVSEPSLCLVLSFLSSTGKTTIAWQGSA